MSKEYRLDEPVPQEERHYKFLDMVSTWMGGNAHPASWYVGGTIAAVGMAGVFGITFLANPLAYAIMAAIGYIGYRVSTNSPGICRVSFGLRGGNVPSFINTLSLLGWVSNGIFLASISISYILASVFGTPAYGEAGSNIVLLGCVIAMGVVSALCVSISGSKSVKIVENILVIMLVILTVWITVIVLKTFPLKQIMEWRAPADMALPYGKAFDQMAAYSFGWMLCLAEFTRYTKKAATATIAPMIGANLSMFWFALVGAIGVIGVALKTGVFDPNQSDPSSVVSALGMGVVALLVIITAVLTTNMINLYCGTIAINSIFPKAKFRPTLIVFTILAIALGVVPIYLTSFMDFFYAFMHFLGALYPPMCAIIIVDYFFIRKRKYEITEMDRKGGIYWYKHGINWYGMVALVLGAALYIFLEAVGFGANNVGVVFPNFFFSAIIYFVLAKIALKRNAYPTLQSVASK